MSPHVALFRALIEFASETSGLPDPGGVPEVRFVSTCDIVQISQGIPQEAPGCGASEKLAPMALYVDDVEEVIYMGLDCASMETKTCWVIFAHEATHWLQDQAGLIDPERTWCISDRIEPPAYAVGNAAAIALGAFDMLRGPGFVAIVSSCDRR